MSFTDRLINGEPPFYNRKNYEDVTRTEMESLEPLSPPAYIHNTESKVWRVVKEILAYIIFPIKIYQLVHSLVGRVVISASARRLFGQSPEQLSETRGRFAVTNKGTDWKSKLLTIEVDGTPIDVVIVGKPSTLNNGRWVLFSNGNGEHYEDHLPTGYGSDFENILNGIDGNGIVFNYTGVGASSGAPSRTGLVKAYDGVLSFLEDGDKGIGATEITCLGHSLGGGVQGDTLNSHKLKAGISYVFVKSMTFADLSAEVSKMIASPVGALIKLIGWNMSSVKSSKKLQYPEIIMQKADVANYTDIANRIDLISESDTVIFGDASLAKRLLGDANCPRDNKYFLGVPDYHNDGYSDVEHLYKKINEMHTVQQRSLKK